MEISKLSYEGDAIDGTGSDDNKSCRIKMLEWVQANPDKCKHTNMTTLSHQLGIALGGSDKTFLTYLAKSLKEGVLSRTNGKRRADFKINYFHPAVPKGLLDTASDEDKQFIADVHERASKMGGKVDSEGAIETPSIEWPEEDEAQEIPVEQSLPVEVKQTRKGTQITFTININL